MELSRILAAIGLSKSESEVYMTLLKGGTQTISSISKESGIHRPAIYAALPKLKTKGLVSERQVGKLIHYAAESPERLRSLLDDVHVHLDTVIPELTAMQNKKTPVVRRLDGVAGIHAVYEDIVNSCEVGEEFYRYSSEGTDELKKVGVPKSYFEHRDGKKLERLVITNPDYMKNREPQLEVSLKVVPKEFLPFDYNVSQIIYANKIAFIDFTQQIATIIENPTLAKFQRDIFRMLFRRL